MSLDVTTSAVHLDLDTKKAKL